METTGAAVGGTVNDGAACPGIGLAIIACVDFRASLIDAMSPSSPPVFAAVPLTGAAGAVAPRHEVLAAGVGEFTGTGEAARAMALLGAFVDFPAHVRSALTRAPAMAWAAGMPLMRLTGAGVRVTAGAGALD